MIHDSDACLPYEAAVPRRKGPEFGFFVIARLLEETAYFLDQQDIVFEMVVK